MGEKAEIQTRAPGPTKGNHTAKAQKITAPQSAFSLVDHIRNLHKTVGNQVVQRLYRSGLLQAKLRIGQPNDVYEQEADRVADQVMRMPDNTAISSQQSALSKVDKAVQAKSVCPLSKGPSCGEEERTGEMIMPERIRPSDGGSGRSPDAPAKESGCSGWQQDPQSTSKVAAEHYLVTELGPFSRITAGLVKSVTCDTSPLCCRDTGGIADCFVEFSNGLQIHVTIYPDKIQVSGPKSPVCIYDYTCPPSGGLVLRKRHCL